MHTHTHTHTYIHTHTHICIHYIHTCAHARTHTRISKTQKRLENITLTRRIKKSALSRKGRGAATVQYLALPTATSIHFPPRHTSPTKTLFIILLGRSRLPFGLVTQTSLIPHTHYVARPSPFFSQYTLFDTCSETPTMLFPYTER
jgi:hypothetical protein